MWADQEQNQVRRFQMQVDFTVNIVAGIDLLIMPCTDNLLAFQDAEMSFEAVPQLFVAVRV